MQRSSQTLETDLKMMERGSLPLQICCGEGRRKSRPFQVDAVAFVGADLEGHGRGRSPELGRHEEEEGTEGEKREGPSGLIYKGESKMAGAGIKEPETAE